MFIVFQQLTYILLQQKPLNDNTAVFCKVFKELTMYQMDQGVLELGALGQVFHGVQTVLCHVNATSCKVKYE